MKSLGLTVPRSEATYAPGETHKMQHDNFGVFFLHALCAQYQKAALFFTHSAVYIKLLHRSSVSPAHTEKSWLTCWAHLLHPELHTIRTFSFLCGFFYSGFGKAAAFLSLKNPFKLRIHGNLFWLLCIKTFLQGYVTLHVVRLEIRDLCFSSAFHLRISSQGLKLPSLRIFSSFRSNRLRRAEMISKHQFPL